MEYKNLIHLDYNIDKERYVSVFWDNLNKGCWHRTVQPWRNMYWWQIYMNTPEKVSWVQDVIHDLNIDGMNNFPRFSYQFANSLLPHHLDEDEMVSININLLETTPTIHIENKPYPYECAFIDVGHKMHGVEPDINDRLILKFCIRHPWEEVYDRLQEANLIHGQ